MLICQDCQDWHQKKRDILELHDLHPHKVRQNAVDPLKNWPNRPRPWWLEAGWSWPSAAVPSKKHRTVAGSFRRFRPTSRSSDLIWEKHMEWWRIMTNYDELHDELHDELWMVPWYGKSPFWWYPGMENHHFDGTLVWKITILDINELIGHFPVRFVSLPDGMRWFRMRTTQTHRWFVVVLLL